MTSPKHGPADAAIPSGTTDAATTAAPITDDPVGELYPDDSVGELYSDDSVGELYSDDSVGELYRDFRPWLLGYARMLNPEAADDAVQDAFAALASRIERPPPVANMRGYLVTVVQRGCRRGWHRRLPDRVVALWPSLVNRRHYDRYQDPDLARAFDRLSDQQRTCVALRYGHDQTIDDIAEMLELNPSTVKTHLARALKTLRAELEEK